MRRSKKADESSVESYSSKASSLASSLKSVSQAAKKGVDVLTRPLKRVKTILLSKKTRSSLPSSPEPSVIDIDAIDTATKSDDEEDLDAELRKTSTDTTMSVPYRFNTEKLKKNWRSPVYAFFDIDRVAVQNVDGRNCHFFPCAAQKCKTRIGGVRRFQDSKDKASTANLKNHAIGCFGNKAVKVACIDKQAPDVTVLSFSFHFFTYS
ncbi:uncharacterized protein BJ212DRAFT_1484769 [Suillus subaureus]|uniref:Uncharacterized protein n=1 Tax=Suillus subaureus TaxID=48587 RepID=A0A9P7J8U9_9AGAM|nr:uncharacterized protein BJ212DRAFT_1484769 [Suillus subaureus]KAG1808914.1 hypothetical protein BJ212DRAFT_1484769 [Suillus subaureus]